MKRGKAQYSFEFLVTYGWAILVLGIIVAAIYTFGWVDPANFMPQKCSFYGQTGCKDFFISEQYFNLSLVNNFGSDLKISKTALIIDGKDVCSEDVDLDWNKSKNVMVGLNLTSANCIIPVNKSIIDKNIIPGKRVDIISKIYFYSESTCPSCTPPGICPPECLHITTGRILSKVSK